MLNVAITCARAALIAVGDQAACAQSEVPYLESFVKISKGTTLRYLKELDVESVPQGVFATNGLDYPIAAQPELVSDWQRQFYKASAEWGIFTIPQYPVHQHLLDLALVTEDGRRLDIEIDGEKYHRDPWTGENVRRDHYATCVSWKWDGMYAVSGWRKCATIAAAVSSRWKVG